jgi:hypothetical protein
MREVESYNEPKSSATISIATAPLSDAGVSPAAGLAFKASAVVDTLYDVGMNWAGTGLGYGRIALENSARALERTACKLGTLEDKLKKGEALRSASAEAAS